MVIVPDEAEFRERMRQRHERFLRMTEGKSERFKRRMMRVERTEVGQDIPMVRVLPKNDEVRVALVHPGNNLPFRATGSAEWPLDQFTLRRLRDGDVTLDESYAHQPVRQMARQTEPVRRAPPVHRPRPQPHEQSKTP